MNYRLVPSLCLPALIGLILVAANMGELSEPCVRNMDRAYTHLAVESAARFEAFDGAFSHAGFRHPGPVFFYYLAGMRFLMGGIWPPKGDYHAATLFLNCFFLSIALCLAAPRKLNSPECRRGAQWWQTALLAALFTALIGASGSLLMDYWNPYPVVSAALAYMLALSRFAGGGVSLLPLIVAIASFIAQCHVGTPPFLAIGFLYAGGILIFRHRTALENQSVLSSLSFSLVILLLLWAPVLVDILWYGGSSNPAIVLASFLEEKKTRDIFQSFRFVWRMVGEQTNIVLGAPSALISYLPAILLIGLAIVGWKKRGSRGHLARMLILAWAVTIWALSKSFQPFAEYLVSYFFAVIVLSWFLVTVEIPSLLFPRLKCVKGVLPALVQWGLVLFLGLRAFPGLFDGVAKGGCGQIKFAQAYVEQMKTVETQRYYIRPEDYRLRSFVVFLALALVKEGIPFCFDDKWDYYVGRAFTCSYRRAKDPNISERKVAIRFEGNFMEGRAAGKKKRSQGDRLLRRAIVMEWEDGSPPTRRLIWRDSYSIAAKFE